MGYSFTAASAHKITYPHQSSFDGLSKLSVSVWLKPSSTQDLGGIVCQMGGNITGSGSRSGFGLYHAGTNAQDLNARARNDTTSPSAASSGNSMALNSWHHILWVYDGTQATNANRSKVYLDGVALSLTHTGTHSTTLGTNDRALKLGQADDGWDKYVTCVIAEVALWAGVSITDSGEIANLAAGYYPNVARPTDLTFYAPLSSNANDTIGGVVGTVTGATIGDHPTMTGGVGAGAPVPQIIFIN